MALLSLTFQVPFRFLFGALLFQAFWPASCLFLSFLSFFPLFFSLLLLFFFFSSLLLFFLIGRGRYTRFLLGECRPHITRKKEERKKEREKEREREEIVKYAKSTLERVMEKEDESGK